ncbi:MAG: hypothetical protein CEN87_640 [Parcubacteria group bacterium Licking1014_1]|nr:MAG: hypothetical protein CEN87_640 [Parcubacteria group bacterium Licking1014_1]
MFILPNGSKIDEGGVIKGLSDDDDSRKYYLDAVTGEVGIIDVKDKKINDKIADDKRYFEIPRVPEKDKIKNIKKFINEMVSPENRFLGNLLNKILKGGIGSFLKLLKKTDWIYGWPQWERDCLYDKMLDWFETLPVEIKDDWEKELDDDCPLCQSIKQGNHTVYDFKKSAAKMPNWQSKEKNEVDFYYDAMEHLDGTKKSAKEALEILFEALKIDSDCAQTHVGLACAYGEFGDKTKTREHIKKAFEETRKKFPKWPKELSWGVIENRAYLRAIQWMADEYANCGEKEEAEELYKLLLKLNPNDNQGVRYTLSGLYAGISGEEINSMFDEGNKKQNWDKLEKLVKAQNKKHHFWKEPKYE